MTKRVDLLINSLRGGGAEKVCVSVANGLIENGFKVRLLLLNLENEVYFKDLNEKVKVTILNKKHARDSVFSLFRYIIKEKPKKFLVFNYQLTVILILLRFIFKFKFKLIARSINTLSEESKLEKSLIKKSVNNYLVRKVYGFSDIIISQSVGMQEDLIKNYKIDAKKIVVINNPVSKKIEEKARVHQDSSLNYKSTKKNILFVGRLSPQKGLDDLIAAIEISIKREPNLYLKIVGDGPLKQHLQETVIQKGLNEHIDFKDFTNKIDMEFLQSDLTVLTSKYEGFPNVLLESITLGVPVVSYDCPSGPSEIILEGINGYLVQRNNISEMAESIILALNNDWDKTLIKETAKRYSTKKIMSEYSSLLKKD